MMKTAAYVSAGHREGSRSYRIALTGLFAALSYVVFTFLQIKITLPGGDATSIHLGNAVCVLGGLILGSFYGGLGGAIGMTIGDLLDPVYVVYAPTTFIQKFCIGMITGFVAHKLGKINARSDHAKLMRWVTAASVCGMLFNVTVTPVMDYGYKILIAGKAAAQVALSWDLAATSINAVLSVIAACLVYLPVRKGLERSGLFDHLR